LGSNEDAAQKSVSRAVEKLRAHFARRGIAVSSALIVSALAAGAVQAAPVGLASLVVAGSLASAGTAGFITTLTQTLLMKKTAIIVTLCVLTVLVSSITVVKLRRAGATHAPVTGKNLNQGLVLHLTFDHDETGDGRITDSSNGGNDGRASGVRWSPDGKLGGAYEFTKDGDEIVVQNNASLNASPLTLSAWIKTTAADSIWRRIFDKSYTRGYALSIAGDWQQKNWRGLASLEMGPGTHFILSKTRLTDGQWHQVVTTFNGTNEVLYVDGQAESSLSWKRQGRVGPTDFNLVIGCNRSNLKEDDLGTSFRGFIDEPMMWNRALSEKEIAYLFQSQNGPSAGTLAAN